LPEAEQVAVFDTAFHQTMPESAKVLPGPYEWYEKYGIRRFGFHGISHKYCASRVGEIIGDGSGAGGERIITCHLGAGASLAAIKNGVSVMTTMSYTPLDGLIMKTRSGAIDAGVLLHLLRKGIYSADKLNQALNGESGVKGISGLSGDMRELLQFAGGNKRAQLALDMFVDSVASNIAALIPRLGGLDVLVFAAGIGENSPEIRLAVCKKLAFMGVELDERQNADSAEDKLISASGSKVKCLVVHTREDLLIARECARLVRK
jgi:acetate kinase